MTASPADSPAQPPVLRPYQMALIDDVYRKIQDGHRRIAIVAGTGAGKTVISGQICAHACDLGLRLMFLVHLDVLVGQTFRKLQSFGLSCGFIKAGWKEDPTAPIQIASIQTMAKRDWWRKWPADVVFYDEAHTTVFSQIGQAVMDETHPKAVHLAMTATPYRLGKDQLGDRLDTLVASPVPAELQRLGFLAPMKYFSLPADGQVELGDVRIVAGDYDERALKNACDRPELVDRIVAEWQRLVPGKRTVAFCVDVEHARHVAEAFQNAAIAADVVEGNTPPKERARLYRALGDGELLVLASCNVISIGFDEPSVEVGLLLRPTQSLALHHQQIGRVMRISPASGKTHGIILDQAGNLHRLGFPEDIDRYELPVGEGESADPKGTPKYKACPSCNAWMPQSALKCTECNHLWTRDPEIRAEQLVQLLSPNDLKELDDEETLKKLFSYHRQRNFRKGYAPNLANQAFYDQTGRLPELDWYRGSIFGDRPTAQDRQAYKHYLTAAARRTRKPITWVVEEFQKEFGAGDWQRSFL